MRKPVLGVVAALMLALLGGCGGGDGPHSVSITLSGDAPTDGYVERAVVGGGLTTVQADGIRTQSPIPGTFPERRGFASFLIAPVPVGATLDRGDLRLYVDFVSQDVVSIPVTVDVYHVHYGDPLTFGAFNTPATFVTTVHVDTSRIGSVLLLDVLPELQIDVDNPSAGFFQLMFVATGGIVEFQDSERSFTVPITGPEPRLDVTYF